MLLRPEQQKVHKMLSEMIKTLCLTGLQYTEGFCIEGLLGITLDDKEVFLVNINEQVSTANHTLSYTPPTACSQSKCQTQTGVCETVVTGSVPSIMPAYKQCHGRHRLWGARRGLHRRFGHVYQRMMCALDDPETSEISMMHNQQVHTSHVNTSPSQDKLSSASTTTMTAAAMTTAAMTAAAMTAAAMTAPIKIEPEDSDSTTQDSVDMDSQHIYSLHMHSPHLHSPHTDKPNMHSPHADSQHIDNKHIDSEHIDNKRMDSEHIDSEHMDISDSSSPYQHRFDMGHVRRACRPVTDEAMIARVKLAIMKEDGCFVTSRMLCRRYSAFFKGHIVVATMKVLTVPVTDPEHIGTFHVLNDRSKVFYKCPPDRINPAILAKYQMSLEQYQYSFHQTPHPKGRLTPNWQVFVQNILLASPYGPLTVPEYLDSPSPMSTENTLAEFDLQQFIVHTEGCFVSSRILCRRLSKQYKVANVICAMKAMTRPQSDPRYVGQFVRVSERIKVFFKAPPRLLGCDACDLYNITAEHYCHLYYASPRPLDGSITNWDNYVENVGASFPFSASDLPLDSCGVSTDVAVRIRTMLGIDVESGLTALVTMMHNTSTNALSGDDQAPGSTDTTPSLVDEIYEQKPNISEDRLADSSQTAHIVNTATGSQTAHSMHTAPDSDARLADSSQTTHIVNTATGSQTGHSMHT